MLPYFIWLGLGIVIGFAVDWLFDSGKRSGHRRGAGSSAAAQQTVPAAQAAPAITDLASSEREKKIWVEEELSILFEISEKISLLRDKSKIAKEIVESVCKFLNTRIGVLSLVDKASDVLRIKYAQGLPLEVIETCVIHKDESISGLAWSRNELLISQDLQNDTWLKGVNREPYLQRGFIVVPLSVKEEVIGVLIVSERRTTTGFSNDDAIFVTNVARIASVTLYNLELYDQVEKSYLNTITTLALTLDARDPYTKMHSENVTFYALAIAGEIGLRSAEKELIRYAGLLHDIGKIGIRDEILLKPGKLTAEEFEQIKSHPLKGEALVRPLSFLKDVPSIIRHHHERYDGKGYPDGMAGERIELSARILSVADTFDAMTTDRPYRKALSLDEALSELKRCKGTQFDPGLVDYFLKAVQGNPDIAHRLSANSSSPTQS